MEQPRVFDRIADEKRLDAVGDALRRGVHAVLRPGVVKDLLHGVFLGHPLHPALVQVPIGCFASAAVLDIGGSSREATKLIGLGVLSSVPAAAAGLADYADSQQDQRRVGVVHAAANSAALVCYVASLALRAGGRQRAGVWSAMAGLTFSMAGATLGGDLAFRRAVGANHSEHAGRLGPADWCDLGPVDQFPEAKPIRRVAAEIPVLVVRRGKEFSVLHDQCSHMSGPLSEGELTEVDGAECVQCPWHGSVFRLDDGRPAHGPATAPQQRLDSRVRASRLEVKTA
ncbi:Rieske 2Fe-2S domain-containing protein [Kutzneria chonburiensis]|uniref:Rieske 2Fe-2S domain-containing protein n=1 Tax=Kutzneria chonburiensis TaxID=1483604 RepID=A0ABV6MR51_9PSEU|nr:Rieske 2Fe-2S domain-containing protein [Kutzneria chonburiensis]